MFLEYVNDISKINESIIGKRIRNKREDDSKIFMRELQDKLNVIQNGGVLPPKTPHLHKIADYVM